jgi:hypothetical protein
MPRGSVRLLRPVDVWIHRRHPWGHDFDVANRFREAMFKETPGLSSIGRQLTKNVNPVIRMNIRITEHSFTRFGHCRSISLNFPDYKRPFG